MKILFLHRYGKLTDWNHRIKRQIKLMKELCDLKEIGMTADKIDVNLLKNVIRDFNPDIVYVNGWQLGSVVVKLHDKVIFDVGSHRTRNAILHTHKLNFNDMKELSKEELLRIANWKGNVSYYSKEKEIMDKVKGAIVWEGEEAWLLRQLYGNESKIHEVSMIFYDTPKPIPWDKKKDRVISIAAKWSKEGKGSGLLKSISNDIKIESIGNQGNLVEFMPHDELMDYINESKVVFCPYICGGIGIINEALKLDCNIVIASWHPYLTYINRELVFNSKNEIADKIEMARKRYYPSKELPTEEVQLNKIMQICQKSI